MKTNLNGGCLLPNEEIIVKDGLVLMSEIKVGDKVLSHDGDYHEVEHVWNFEKPTIIFNISVTESPSVKSGFPTGTDSLSLQAHTHEAHGVPWLRQYTLPVVPMVSDPSVEKQKIPDQIPGLWPDRRW